MEPPFVLVLVVLVLEFGLWSAVELILWTGLRESFFSRREQVIVAGQFIGRFVERRRLLAPSGAPSPSLPPLARMAGIPSLQDGRNRRGL